MKRKKSQLKALLILALLAGLIISSLKINFLVWAHDTYEALMNLNPGFSSARNIIDDGGFVEKQSVLYKGLSIVKKTPLMIKHIILDSNVDTELPSLEFEIKFSNLIKLNEDRVNSINQGF